MSEDEVNHSQVGNVFMLGAGGIVAVALSAPLFSYYMHDKSTVIIGLQGVGISFTQKFRT